MLPGDDHQWGEGECRLSLDRLALFKDTPHLSSSYSQSSLGSLKSESMHCNKTFSDGCPLVLGCLEIIVSGERMGVDCL